MVLRRETLPYAEATDLDASIRSVALGPDRRPRLGPAGRSSTRPTKARIVRRRGVPELPRTGRRLGLGRLVRPPRALPGDLRPAPVPPARLPERPGPPGDPGPLGGRAFGEGRPAEHYVRSSSEFAEHARAVARLIGRRIAQHRGVFLGGADVLRRPVERRPGLPGDRSRRLPDRPRFAREPGDHWDDFPAKLGEVHAFLDDFAAPCPTSKAGGSSEARHLGRVTLGRRVGRPGDPGELRQGLARSTTFGRPCST